jgi:hypothetical protein
MPASSLPLQGGGRVGKHNRTNAHTASGLLRIQRRELSGDNTVAPDDAATAKEAIAYYLHRLTPKQITAIEKQLSKLGDYAEELE